MHNMALVLKHEITSTLGKRSFWLTTFLLPLLVLAMSFGSQWIANQAFEESASPIDWMTASLDVPNIGYVDPAGLLAELPPGFPPDLARPFADEAAALAALEAGEIEQYALIPADYIATGDLVIVATEFNIFQQFSGNEVLKYLISYNLIGDPTLALLVDDPTPIVQSEALQPRPSRDESFSTTLLSFAVPYAVLFIFFFTLTMSSSFMLQSVSREKESRVAEVLLLSLRPRELMLGKILGLGVVALLQIAIWSGGGMVALSRSLQGANLDGLMANFELPPGFLLWIVGYFILGYLMYASVMAAIGALAPTAREGGQFTFIVILPLMIPLWFNNAFHQAPNGGLATFLSLFPLTSPVSMATRMVAGTVPLWQPVVGLLLLAATAYGFILLSARFFRADTLLSDAALNWSRFRQELSRK